MVMLNDIFVVFLDSVCKDFFFLSLFPAMSIRETGQKFSFLILSFVWFIYLGDCEFGNVSSDHIFWNTLKRDLQTERWLLWLLRNLLRISDNGFGAYA